MAFDLGGLIGSVAGGLLGADASGDAADAAAAGTMAGVRENRRQFDTVLNLQAPVINTGNAARSMLASILGIEQPAYSYTPGATNGQATLPVAQPSRIVGGGRYVIPGRATTQPVTGGTSGGLTFTQPASKPMTAEEIQSRLEAFPGYKFAVDQATKSAQAAGSATGSLGGNVLAALGERVGGQIAPAVFNDYLNRLSSLAGNAQTAGNAVSSGALATGNSIAQGLQAGGDARASGILGQTNSIGGMLYGLGNAFGGLGGSKYPTSGFTAYTGNPYGNVPYIK